MYETLAALLFAHVLADFVLQTNAMTKSKRQPLTLAKHGAIVLATAALATGSLSPWLLALTAAHLIIDAAKTYIKPGIWPFLADQAAHAVTILIAAPLIQTQWPDGVAPIMALTAGAILATRAGGFAVGLLMDPWADAISVGLTGGGRVIGNLERGLIFLLILTGQTQNIGFLIAAKSVLRFGTVADDRKVSEYVIIGTLASVCWAIAAALLTTILLNQLPTLGIPDLLP
jgi:hypothetical protein